jgi:hypothetical protein
VSERWVLSHATVCTEQWAKAVGRNTYDLRIYVCTAGSDFLRAVSKNILPKVINEVFYRIPWSFLVTLHERSHVSSVYILVEVYPVIRVAKLALTSIGCSRLTAISA